MPRTETTLVLTQDDIERLIDMKTAIRVIADGFKAQARGEVTMPPKVYLPVPDGDFRAMPAYLARPACSGLKWVNVHPRNRARGLPTVMGTIILNNPRTGFPLAIVDGLSVTRLRTGAAGGVAARALARRDSRVAALVGCGAQARSQLQALSAVFRLRAIHVWGYRRGEADRFCRQMRAHAAAPLKPEPTVRDCVREADLIVTVTTSRRPLVMRDWLKPGAHINAIGADAPGKQELDPRILNDALVIIDEREQAIHGGEINVPIAQGLFKPDAIHATLGEVLLGRATGRTSPQQITVFDSTGIAVHDVALGFAAFRRAVRAGAGRPIRLFRTIAPR